MLFLAWIIIAWLSHNCYGIVKLFESYDCTSYFSRVLADRSLIHVINQVGRFSFIYIVSRKLLKLYEIQSYFYGVMVII